MGDKMTVDGEWYGQIKWDRGGGNFAYVCRTPSGIEVRGADTVDEVEVFTRLFLLTERMMAGGQVTFTVDAPGQG